MRKKLTILLLFAVLLYTSILTETPLILLCALARISQALFDTSPTILTKVSIAFFHVCITKQTLLPAVKYSYA